MTLDFVYFNGKNILLHDADLGFCFYRFLPRFCTHKTKTLVYITP